MKQKSKAITRENILEQLKRNDSVNEENIDVEVKGNTVELTGKVDSYVSKIACSQDAMQVATGFEIDNQILVEFEPNENVATDTEITSNIQNLLKLNSQINPEKIQVSVEKRHVELSGIVSDSREKTEAEKVAISVSGVLDVSNRILVKPIAIRADKYIEKDIKRALESSVLVDEDAVVVEVENGVVTLSGRVTSEPVLNEIYEQAISTNGVVDVINEVTIG